MFSILFLCVLFKTNLATLDINELPIVKRELFVPPLAEIAYVLNEGLKEHYSEVDVDVVDCPDLTKPPFTLANVGLNGKTRLVVVGDVRYMFPYVNLSKVYDMHHVVKILELDPAFIIGSTTGPRLYCSFNCEDVVNMNIRRNKVDQRTTIITVNQDGSYVLDELPNNETRFDILADYFVSEGKPGPVLKVHVRKRIGNYSISVSIRKVLANHYKDRIVGLGGTFILKEGAAWHSLAPDFSTTPFYTYKDLMKWMKDYNMSAPLISVGTLVTGQYDLGLRLQHFHTFSYHGDGGHYNIDTTPEIAEYLGYFNTAEYVYRIDRPPSSYSVKLDSQMDE